MKIKVKLILVLLISIIGKECYSQEIDTSKIIMNAKLAILEINDKVVSEKFIEGYIKYKPKYRFLESKGFSKDYIFFEINAEPYFDYDNADTIGEVIEINNYFGGLTYDFIFGYSIKFNKIFNLKGLRSNDFNRLFYLLNIDNSYNSNKRVFKNLKKFGDYFQVEGLDMRCLYKSLKKENNSKFRCLEVVQPAGIQIRHW